MQELKYCWIDSSWDCVVLSLDCVDSLVRPADQFIFPERASVSGCVISCELREMNASLLVVIFRFHFHTKVHSVSAPVFAGEITLCAANLNYKQLLLSMSPPLHLPRLSFSQWGWIGHPAGLFSSEWAPITSMSLQMTIRYTQYKSMQRAFIWAGQRIDSHKWN